MVLDDTILQPMSNIFISSTRKQTIGLKDGERRMSVKENKRMKVKKFKQKIERECCSFILLFFFFLQRLLKHLKNGP